MQELIDELELINSYPMMPLILRLIKDRLEKEKEQMLDFGLYVKKNGWVGCKIEDMFEDYNNQNK